jgi:hypothetical protein
MLMAKLMKEMMEYNRHNLLFAFSNTGKEKEATLEFVERCDQEFGLGVHWVEAKIHPTFGVGTTYTEVDFKTADRTGKPFEAMIAKFGIPNQSFKHCSRELKTRPLSAFAKDYFKDTPFRTALGMRLDEASRAKYGNPLYLYPFLDMNVMVQDVRAFWNSYHFDLALKDYEGNCDLCWKKSVRKKLTLITENPKISDWWVEMEKRYGWLQIPHRQKLTAPCVFHRSNTSTEELIKKAQTEDFKKVTDPFYDEEEACTCSAMEPSSDDEEESIPLVSSK